MTMKTTLSTICSQACRSSLSESCCCFSWLSLLSVFCLTVPTFYDTWASEQSVFVSIIPDTFHLGSRLTWKCNIEAVCWNRQRKASLSLEPVIPFLFFPQHKNTIVSLSYVYVDVKSGKYEFSVSEQFHTLQKLCMGFLRANVVRSIFGALKSQWFSSFWDFIVKLPFFSMRLNIAFYISKSNSVLTQQILLFEEV